MLLKFTISNYRSFKDVAAIEMEACSIKEHTENVFSTTFGSQPARILKSVALLGANSSGKSNLFKAFDLMRYMVINSAVETPFNKTYTIEPFKLSTEKENKPTAFECTMVIKNIVYRYGFKCSNKEVISEWLNMTVKRREEIVFIRTKDEYKIIKRFPTDFKNKLLMLCDLTRNDALYLSVLSQFNIEMARQITHWFSKSTIYSDPNLEIAVNYTAELLNNPVYGTLMNEIIKKADLGFSGIEKQIAEADLTDSRNGMLKIKTKHIKYDSRNRPVDAVYLELNKAESSGTQKLIALLGPIIKALVDGGIFWADDFDANIQPNIITMLMDLFNSDKYNPLGAQLIAVSHNQHILKKLRRDQVILLNKDVFGASTLSALNIQKPQVRSNAIFDKEYLQGLNGGILYISDLLNPGFKQGMDKNKGNTVKTGYN